MSRSVDNRFPTPVAFAAIVLLGACGGGPTAPDLTPASTSGDAAAALVGSYEATNFTVKVGAFSPDGTGPSIAPQLPSHRDMDVLAEGGAFHVRLNADGTSWARMLVRGAMEDGSDFDVSFQGTWHYLNGFVTFSSSLETFIDSTRFTTGTERLFGLQTSFRGDISVELRR
ncbi:MAG: hypothetical protein ACE5HQ_09610 [Gemmatimonadota bacterium]